MSGKEMVWTFWPTVGTVSPGPPPPLLLPVIPPPAPSASLKLDKAERPWEEDPIDNEYGDDVAGGK